MVFSSSTYLHKYRYNSTATSTTIDITTTIVPTQVDGGAA